MHLFILNDTVLYVSIGIVIVAIIGLIVSVRGKKDETLLQSLTRTKPVKSVIDLTKKNKNIIDKQYSRMIRTLSTSNIEERDKSRLYRYYAKYQSALNAVFKSGNVSIATFLLCATLTSGLVSAFLNIGIGNFFMKALTLSVVLYFHHAMLLYFASITLVEKNLAVLDSIDTLCSDIDTGITKSINNNLGVLPNILKNNFIAFVSNSRDANIPTDVLLSELNQRLGHLADKFCDTALLYEETGDRILLKRFEDIMIDNSKIRVRYLRQMRVYQNNSKYFLISAVLVAGISGILIGMMSLPIEAFKTGFPKALMLMSGISIVVAYLLAQLQYTKEDNIL